MGFVVHITPHFVQFRGQSTTLIQLLRTANLYFYLLGIQELQHRMIHLDKIRFLFFNSFMTVLVLTCKTRAVSRMPLAFIAISTICSLTAGD